jgi:fatty-acyl-CoA synthase
MIVARPKSRHLSDLLAEMAAIAPDRPAVISGETELTYGELETAVTKVAAGLEDRGLGRGGTLGLLCPNRWEWVVTAIAALRLGARVAAFNTFAKAWDLGHMLQHSDTEILVTLDRFRSADYLDTLRQLGLPAGEGRPVAPAVRSVVAIGTGTAGTERFEALSAGDRAASPGSTSATDVAFLLYTSGSTARPKGVPMQHYALIENGFEIGERMGLAPGDRVWVSVPLFWAYGACNALMATLTHGATLVLQEAFAAGEALDLIERRRPVAAYLLPNIARALLEDPGFAPERVASLRTGLTLGSPTDLKMIAGDLGIAGICNIYGQTETYGNCCVTPTEWPLERRAGSQGPPLPRVTVEIRDEAGSPLPPDEVGEINVSGYVTPGYVDAPDLADPIGADGFFATGDLGSLDRDGCLHFAARDNEMIKTAGINVSPLEVEEYLTLNGGVREVCVVGVEDERATEVVVAFAVVEDGTSEGELRAWCAEGLAAYKVPARIHVVKELDRTETGKVSRRRMIERDNLLNGDREGQGQSA